MEPPETVEEIVAAFCTGAACSYADGESETKNPQLYANPDSTGADKTDCVDDTRPVAILRGPFTDLDAGSASFAGTSASVPLDVPHV